MLLSFSQQFSSSLVEPSLHSTLPGLQVCTTRTSIISEKCNKQHHLHIFSSVWKRRFLRERKISLMMGTITAAFLLCVTPYYILFMSPVDLQVKETYLPVLVMVMYLNSLVNPLLYVGLNSEVRAGVFRLLLCKPEPKGQRSRMDTGEHIL